MARAAHIGRKASLASATDAHEAVHAVPLKLAQLLAPYKKQGRVSLRVERLPQQTRLSLGTRNNDGSWSLTSDELDDVAYLVPDGVDGGKALSIRIISLVGGNTLAVLEVPVTRGPGDDAPPARTTVNTTNDDVALQALRDEIAELKAAFAAQESELNDARAELGQVKAARTSAAEAELTKLRVEAEARIAKVTTDAEAALARAREAWANEEKTRAGSAEARAHAEIEVARSAWQREAADAAAKAEAAWKTAEAARRSAAEAEWKAKSDKLLAEAHTQGAAARDEAHAVELKGLREMLTKAQAGLAERDGALAKAAAERDEAKRKAEREAQDALAKAEARWKEAEAARVAALETAWRAKLAAATPAATAPAPAPAVDTSKHEEALGAARAELAAAQAALAKVSGEHEAARGAWQRETQEALAQAEAAWKAGDAARLKAAEAEWRGKNVAAMIPPPPPPAEPVNAKLEAEVQALRAELASLKAGSPKAGHDAHEAEARADAAEEALALARMRAKDEIAGLKQTLAKRDEEISRLKAQPAPTSRGYEPPPAAAQPSSIRDFVNRPVERAPSDQKSFVVEIVVAAVLGVIGVFFYPEIEALVFGEPPVVTRPLPPLPRAKPELPKPVERTATLLRDAKLRIDPQAKAAIVAPAKRGAGVVVIEERDGWALVRSDGKTGWVKASFLKESVMGVR